MVVCHCEALNDKAIRAVLVAGACTVDDVERACGAGGDCGGCRPVIEDLLRCSHVSISSTGGNT